MYKVYIVDDEILMIQNIAKTVSWAENGFEIVGYHTDPRIALEEVQAKKPHLVLTDLKMPVLGGIEFIKLVKQSGVDTEFVMLSAFSEFEAARKFFLLEGFDYLLKPLQPMEAEITLERLSRKIAAKNQLTPSTTFVDTQTKNFDDLICYITKNFKKKHTLASLSRHFNMNANYICNLFAKHYESTLTIFLTNIRMQEAAKLILESNMALKEIAIVCGYTDYFYFCRMFKNYYGTPPTQFRLVGQNTGDRENDETGF